MTTNSPNPVDGDVQALIDWLKPQIAELENICDELPFGLDEDDAMQLKVMRFALDRLNATAQPVSDGWVKCSDMMPSKGERVFVFIDFNSDSVPPSIHDAEFTGQTFRRGGATIKPYPLEDGFGVTHWMQLPAAPGGQ